MERAQDKVTDVEVRLSTCGRPGAPGNVDSSGARKNAMLGLVGDSRRSEALHVLLPLREDATHVYTPESDFCRSVTSWSEFETSVPSNLKVQVTLNEK